MLSKRINQGDEICQFKLKHYLSDVVLLNLSFPLSAKTDVAREIKEVFPISTRSHKWKDGSMFSEPGKSQEGYWTKVQLTGFFIGRRFVFTCDSSN
jgi:hypothetical protein